MARTAGGAGPWEHSPVDLGGCCYTTARTYAHKCETRTARILVGKPVCVPTSALLLGLGCTQPDYRYVRSGSRRRY